MTVSALFGPGCGPEGALRLSMRLEASPVCKVSTVISELRQDPGRALARNMRPDAQQGMSPLDWQAQATFILRRAQRELSPRQWLAIRAWYIVPEGDVLRGKREAAVVSLARYLDHELRARRDRHGKRKRLRYVVRQWVRLSGRLPRDDAAEIAQRLGLQPRQVYHVLLSKDPARLGWWRLLDRWRDDGLVRLETVFFEAGWIEHSAEVSDG